MKQELRRVLQITLVGAIGLGAVGASAKAVASKTVAKPAGKPGVDPEALALLRSMSDYLANTKQFSVRTEGSTEVVLRTGEKIDLDHSSQVWLKRPNMLRSDRRGDKVAAEFYYDGRSFTLYGRDRQYFAQAAAPPTLDRAIDAAREDLGIETPISDFVYSRPYDAMTEDLVTITNLGTNTVNGAVCHHLAIRGTETDRQIWIEQGAKPVPRRLVIISKKMKEAPEFRVELSEWNFAPDIDDKLFHFSPSTEAKKIEFLSAAHGTRGGSTREARAEKEQ